MKTGYKKSIETSAQAILDIRASLPDSSFAELYDEVTVPYELRQAHRKNDFAVARAYGWEKPLDDEPSIAVEFLKLYEKVAIFLALCVMMNLMLEEKPKMIYFNATSSLPQGFYLRIPGEGCRRGDYVIYEPSEEIKTLIVKNGWGDGGRRIFSRR